MLDCCDTPEANQASEGDIGSKICFGHLYWTNSTSTAARALAATYRPSSKCSAKHLHRLKQSCPLSLFWLFAAAVDPSHLSGSNQQAIAVILAAEHSVRNEFCCCSLLQMSATTLVVTVATAARNVTAKRNCFKLVTSGALFRQSSLTFREQLLRRAALYFVPHSLFHSPIHSC